MAATTTEDADGEVGVSPPQPLEPRLWEERESEWVWAQGRLWRLQREVQVFSPSSQLRL